VIRRAIPDCTQSRTPGFTSDLFPRFKADQKIKVEVPVHFTGEDDFAKASKKGRHAQRCPGHTVELLVPSRHIPGNFLEADVVWPWKVGDNNKIRTFKTFAVRLLKPDHSRGGTVDFTDR